MFVFEIVTPGTWLDYEDQDWSWKIRSQIDSLKSSFFEANVALNLFIQAQAMPIRLPTREGMERDFKRRSEIEHEVKKEKNSLTWEDARFEAEIRFKREQWSSGLIPRKFEHQRSFIYAQAFLYALDAFDKFLGVLAKEPNVPKEIAAFHKQIGEVFPDLRDVRNTAQHLEDRARGLDKNRKPLDLKPIINKGIHAPGGGVLALRNLDGSRYGSTKSDGHYGQIDVSPESMQHLKHILESVLQSFKWRGSREHDPN